MACTSFMRQFCVYLSFVKFFANSNKEDTRSQNDETLFRRLGSRLETRLQRILSPRLVFFLLFLYSTKNNYLKLVYMWKEARVSRHVLRRRRTGLEMWHVLSPWYVFFPLFLFSFTNLFLSTRIDKPLHEYMGQRWGHEAQNTSAMCFEP